MGLEMARLELGMWTFSFLLCCWAEENGRSRSYLHNLIFVILVLLGPGDGTSGAFAAKVWEGMRDNTRLLRMSRVGGRKMWSDW